MANELQIIAAVCFLISAICFSIYLCMRCAAANRQPQAFQPVGYQLPPGVPGQGYPPQMQQYQQPGSQQFQQYQQPGSQQFQQNQQTASQQFQPYQPYVPYNQEPQGYTPSNAQVGSNPAPAPSSARPAVPVPP